MGDLGCDISFGRAVPGPEWKSCADIAKPLTSLPTKKQSTLWYRPPKWDKRTRATTSTRTRFAKSNKPSWLRRATSCRPHSVKEIVLLTVTRDGVPLVRYPTNDTGALVAAPPLSVGVGGKVEAVTSGIENPLKSRNKMEIGPPDRFIFENPRSVATIFGYDRFVLPAGSGHVPDSLKVEQQPKRSGFFVANPHCIASQNSICLPAHAKVDIRTVEFIPPGLKERERQDTVIKVTEPSLPLLRNAQSMHNREYDDSSEYAVNIHPKDQSPQLRRAEFTQSGDALNLTPPTLGCSRSAPSNEAGVVGDQTSAINDSSLQPSLKPWPGRIRSQFQSRLPIVKSRGSFQQPPCTSRNNALSVKSNASGEQKTEAFAKTPTHHHYRPKNRESAKRRSVPGGHHESATLRLQQNQNLPNSSIHHDWPRGSLPCPPGHVVTSLGLYEEDREVWDDESVASELADRLVYDETSSDDSFSQQIQREMFPKDQVSLSSASSSYQSPRATEVAALRVSSEAHTPTNYRNGSLTPPSSAVPSPVFDAPAKRKSSWTTVGTAEEANDDAIEHGDIYEMIHEIINYYLTDNYCRQVQLDTCTGPSTEALNQAIDFSEPVSYCQIRSSSIYSETLDREMTELGSPTTSILPSPLQIVKRAATIASSKDKSHTPQVPPPLPPRSATSRLPVRSPGLRKKAPRRSSRNRFAWAKIMSPVATLPDITKLHQKSNNRSPKAQQPGKFIINSNE